MQEKSERFLEFSERTDKLANLSGLSLRELAGIIGISQAMLFAYRAGKNKITPKSWKKLEEAEAEAEVARQLGLRIDPKTGEMKAGTPQQMAEAVTEAWLIKIKAIESEIVDLRRSIEAQAQLNQRKK